ncbi:hypothetical protein EEL32_22265 [Brevibacillus laterosporus]|nr:hypothetical protein [Brevibacillus laterosporus]RAP30533.1 hypothetical protein C2W64_01729 [Brevibacillus laterosporus]TPG73274.1 hypothetical protein EEL31_02590 [Brevibacillus laterosporus]TPG77657.1 hypothetical protein EEL32_22265 [Brevibacillus laterosporus]
MIKNTFRVTSLLTSSMLGAGFLSGYEWLRFFTYYGTWGSIGLVLAIIAITWLLYESLHSAYRNQLFSLSQFLAHLMGPQIAHVLGFFTALIIIAYSGIALADQALFLEQTISLPALLGLLGLLVLVFFGARLSTSYLAKIAAGCILGALIIVLFLYSNQAHIPLPSLSYQLNLKWLWNGLLFTGLHLFFSMAVLFPLVKETDSLQSLRLGIGLSGLLFGVIGLFIHFQILSHWHDVHTQLKPIVEILMSQLPYSVYAYLPISLGHVIMLASILLRSLTEPLIQETHLRELPLVLTLVAFVGVIAFFGIHFSFLSPLLYSTITYAGLALFSILIVQFSGKRRPPQGTSDS